MTNCQHKLCAIDRDSHATIPPRMRRKRAIEHTYQACCIECGEHGDLDFEDDLAELVDSTEDDNTRRFSDRKSFFAAPVELVDGWMLRR